MLFIPYVVYRYLLYYSENGIHGSLATYFPKPPVRLEARSRSPRRGFPVTFFATSWLARKSYCRCRPISRFRETVDVRAEIPWLFGTRVRDIPSADVPRECPEKKETRRRPSNTNDEHSDASNEGPNCLESRYFFDGVMRN